MDDVTYLQGGSVGPSARPVIERIIELIREFEADPLRRRHGDLLGPMLETSREKLARFVGTTPDRIALVLNTTMGMNIPGQGLIWERGSDVLLSDQEYPAVRALWEWLAGRDGLNLNYIPLPTPPDSPQDIVDAYEAGFTDKTRVVVFSHVYFTTGLVAPIKELTRLTHDHEAVAMVDGAHAVGMVPLDLSEVGCDFYASSSHKWLLAPKGVGFLYMDAKYQNKIRPVVIGHNMRETDAASRYDVNGTRDLTHHACLGDAIDYQLEIGWDSRIRPYCLGLARYLKAQAVERIRGARLTIPMDESMSGFISSFSIEGIDLPRVCQYLWTDYKIEVTANQANGLSFFRVSTHFYDSYDDIDRFISAINEIIVKYPDVHLDRERP
jgi:isopenicillin-N epimerase